MNQGQRSAILYINERRWLLSAAVVLFVLILALLLGQRASLLWLVLLVAGLGAVALLARPVLGVAAMIMAALVVPFEIGTGTEVTLNAVTLLIPAVAGIWLLGMVRAGKVQSVRSRVNRPLLLFLLFSLISLVIGQATWDPAVLQNPNFWIVQLAQWAIFAFSALAFWLMANLVRDKATLARLTWTFLLVGGGIAVARAVGLGGAVVGFATVAFIRAPFWILLFGLGLGQLLFNNQLRQRSRLFLVLVAVASLVFAFIDQQEAISNWAALAVVAAVLIWLRFPRWRLPIVAAVGMLVAIGVLYPAVYQFAGGDDEWLLSGGSRLALIERVVSVSLRNPVLGLGPAAYRPYANATPLLYLGAYWVGPLINSHNNYVDLFAHGGLVGVGLFGWFSWEVIQLGRRLARRYKRGFAAGYVNGMVAAWAASLAVMLLADWILPFVYNIGFPGFQASVLVWLFLGGLVALDREESTIVSG